MFLPLDYFEIVGGKKLSLQMTFPLQFYVLVLKLSCVIG